MKSIGRRLMERFQELFGYRTPREIRELNEQKNFVVSAEALVELNKRRLNETQDQLERIFERERELMSRSFGSYGHSR